MATPSGSPYFFGSDYPSPNLFTRIFISRAKANVAITNRSYNIARLTQIYYTVTFDVYDDLNNHITGTYTNVAQG